MAAATIAVCKNERYEEPLSSMCGGRGRIGRQEIVAEASRGLDLD